jgi:hypothetical protein
MMRYLYILVVISAVLSLGLSGCNIVINTPSSPSGNGPSGGSTSVSGPSSGAPHFGVHPVPLLQLQQKTPFASQGMHARSVMCRQA